jgi:hypothetical protein
MHDKGRAEECLAGIDSVSDDVRIPAPALNPAFHVSGGLKKAGPALQLLSDSCISIILCWARGAMTHQDISSDYRVQELLRALNEGILDLEFVRTRIAEWAGSSIDLIQYSDGEYGILMDEFQKST